MAIRIHWSKPSSFQSPVRRKITGMLGMTVHYPSLFDYEQALERHCTDHRDSVPRTA